MRDEIARERRIRRITLLIGAVAGFGLAMKAPPERLFGAIGIHWAGAR